MTYLLVPPQAETVEFQKVVFLFAGSLAVPVGLAICEWKDEATALGHKLFLAKV